MASEANRTRSKIGMRIEMGTPGSPSDTARILAGYRHAWGSEKVVDLEDQGMSEGCTLRWYFPCEGDHPSLYMGPCRATHPGASCPSFQTTIHAWMRHHWPILPSRWVRTSWKAIPLPREEHTTARQVTSGRATSRALAPLVGVSGAIVEVARWGQLERCAERSEEG